MIRAPSEMRCRLMPKYSMNTKVSGQHQRDGDRHDQAGAQAQAHEADHQDDGHRLEQRLGEAADRLLDDRGLVGDQVHADADRQVGLDLPHALVRSASPNSSDVAALRASMAMPMARVAVVAEHRLRRIGVAALNVRDVGQPEEPVVGPRG